MMCDDAKQDTNNMHRIASEIVEQLSLEILSASRIMFLKIKLCCSRYISDKKKMYQNRRENAKFVEKYAAICLHSSSFKFHTVFRNNVF